MAEFCYSDLFSLGEDPTPYRLLSPEYVTRDTFASEPVVRVAAAGLTLLAATAMREIAHRFRPGHLQQLRTILDDPEASDNDRYVAFELLKNAVIAADGILPSCQDTGTATVVAKKGSHVWVEGGKDQEALSRGIFNTYTQSNLRYSQVAPLTMYEEKNTGTNLPAQIDIEAVDGAAYKFLFLAKGGGSSNKTFLFQENKTLLTPERLTSFLREKITAIGTAACPPYHLAVVIGGTSPERNLKTVKLAAARYLDGLPTTGNSLGRAFRDLEVETTLHAITRQLGLGAQYGGIHFVHDVRVIRMPRHGASCPVGIGLSCSADRQILGRIDEQGLWIEELERDPARFLPDLDEATLGGTPVRIDLNQPMTAIRAELSRHPVQTRVMLTGPIVVARDIAHAKLKARLDQGLELPDYLKNHVVYYAGPAKTPDGYASGSFGPTTGGRMDGYVDLFQSRGGSLVMLAKGNRGAQVTEACKRHGGFYLGSIGGAAALLAKECIRKVEVIDYPELGMEAVFRIEVENFPAFLVVDDKGHDFFAELAGRR